MNFLIILLALIILTPMPLSAQRPLARDLGIEVGVLPPGKNNAITDVEGVRVGQVTISRGTAINTGITAILPPGDNVFQRKVPAAIKEAGKRQSPDGLIMIVVATNAPLDARNLKRYGVIKPRV